MRFLKSARKFHMQLLELIFALASYSGGKFYLIIEKNLEKNDQGVPQVQILCLIMIPRYYVRLIKN